MIIGLESFDGPGLDLQAVHFLVACMWVEAHLIPSKRWSQPRQDGEFEFFDSASERAFGIAAKVFVQLSLGESPSRILEAQFGQQLPRIICFVNEEVSGPA